MFKATYPQFQVATSNQITDFVLIREILQNRSLKLGPYLHIESLPSLQ